MLLKTVYLLQNSFIHQIKSSATKITSESNIEVLLTLIQSWFFIIKTETSNKPLQSYTKLRSAFYKTTRLVCTSLYKRMHSSVQNN